MVPLEPTDQLSELASKLLAASKEWFPDIYSRGLRGELIHATLGVTGEAGELANWVKKLNRSDGDPDEHFLGAAALEAADVLIYTLLVFAILGVDPWEIVAQKHAMNDLRFSSNKSGA